MRAHCCPSLSALSALQPAPQRSRPQQPAASSSTLQVVLPLSVAAVAFAAGASAAAWPFLFMAGVLALTFWLYREQLVLVGRLLSVGTRALGDNPGVVGAAMGLQLAGGWARVWDWVGFAQRGGGKGGGGRSWPQQQQPAHARHAVGAAG